MKDNLINTNQNQIESAVLFLVFNRPDVTERVFDAIRLAKPPRLYIAADGPRSTKNGEYALCEDVKKIVENIDWPCAVSRLFRKNNLGCRKAVSSAITWFFQHEEQGIIIEDDVLPSPDFFRFCDFALNKYKYDARVGMIAGSNLLGAKVESSEYIYSCISSIWGWATWRRAWLLYDEDMIGWPNKWLIDSLKFRFKSKLSEYLVETFNSHLENTIDTWDTQWMYTCAFNNFLCVTPRANLVSNIGIVGTHSSIEMPNHNIEFGVIANIEFISPPKVVPDPYFDELITFSKLTPALKIQKLSRLAKKMGLHSHAKRVYNLIKTMRITS